MASNTCGGMHKSGAWAILHHPYFYENTASCSKLKVKKMIKEHFDETSMGEFRGDDSRWVAGLCGGAAGCSEVLVERAVQDPMDRQCQSGPCTGVVGWRLLVDGQKA